MDLEIVNYKCLNKKKYNFTFLPNVINMVRGQNGSGKTTLLNCIHYIFYSNFNNRPKKKTDCIVKLNFGDYKIMKNYEIDSYIYEYKDEILDKKQFEIKMFGRIINQNIFLNGCFYNSENNFFLTLSTKDKFKFIESLFFNIDNLQQNNINLIKSKKNEHSYISKTLSMIKFDINKLLDAKNIQYDDILKRCNLIGSKLDNNFLNLIDKYKNIKTYDLYIKNYYINILYEKNTLENIKEKLKISKKNLNDNEYNLNRLMIELFMNYSIEKLIFMKTLFIFFRDIKNDLSKLNEKFIMINNLNELVQNYNIYYNYFFIENDFQNLIKKSYCDFCGSYISIHQNIDVIMNLYNIKDIIQHIKEHFININLDLPIHINNFYTNKFIKLNNIYFDNFYNYISDIMKTDKKFYYSIINEDSDIEAELFTLINYKEDNKNSKKLDNYDIIKNCVEISENIFIDFYNHNKSIINNIYEIQRENQYIIDYNKDITKLTEQIIKDENDIKLSYDKEISNTKKSLSLYTISDLNLDIIDEYLVEIKNIIYKNNTYIESFLNDKKNQLKENENLLERIKSDIKCGEIIEKCINSLKLNNFNNFMTKYAEIFNHFTLELFPKNKNIKMIYELNINLEKIKINFIFEDKNFSYDMLSSGQKAILDISNLLTFNRIYNLDFLIIDEGLNHLDNQNIKRVIDFLNDEKFSNKIVIIVTHNNFLFDMTNFNEIHL